MKKFIILVAMVAAAGSLLAKGAEFQTGGAAWVVSEGGTIKAAKKFLAECPADMQKAYKQVLGGKYDLMKEGWGEWRLTKSTGKETNHGYAAGKAIDASFLPKDIDCIKWRLDADSEWATVLKVGSNYCFNPLTPPPDEDPDEEDVVDDTPADRRPVDRDTRLPDRSTSELSKILASLGATDGHTTINIVVGGAAVPASSVSITEPRIVYDSYHAPVETFVSRRNGLAAFGNALASFGGAFVGTLVGNRRNQHTPQVYVVDQPSFDYEQASYSRSSGWTSGTHYWGKSRSSRGNPFPPIQTGGYTSGSHWWR